MPKFRCTCENVIYADDGEAWGLLLSEKSEEVFSEGIQEIVEDYLRHAKVDDVDGWMKKHTSAIGISISDVIGAAISSRLSGLSLSVIECDACSRLWSETKPGSNSYQAYVPESSDHSRQKLF